MHKEIIDSFAFTKKGIVNLRLKIPFEEPVYNGEMADKYTALLRVHADLLMKHGYIEGEMLALSIVLYKDRSEKHSARLKELFARFSENKTAVLSQILTLLGNCVSKGFSSSLYWECVTGAGLRYHLLDPDNSRYLEFKRKEKC